MLNDETLRQEYDRKKGFILEAPRRQQNIQDNPWAYPPSKSESDDQRINLSENQSVWLSGFQGKQGSKETYSSLSPAKARLYGTACKDDSLKARYEELVADREVVDGVLLKELREMAGVSIDEMQDRTKVSMHYIQALKKIALKNFPLLFS